MSVENVFRVAALSVFVMFFAVLIFFKEPRKEGEAVTASMGQALKNFGTVATNFKFILFLLIFSGYWIVYWQEFIILPLYVAKYIDPKADTELMLMTGPIVVITLTIAANVLMEKMQAFKAVVLGAFITAIAWVLLIWRPSVPMAIATLVVVSLGEITQSPRYYDYVSRLAPSGQQGTYMGFAFLPIGIGSFLGGPIGGWLLKHYAEDQQNPTMVWWVVTGIGLLTFALLSIYDRVFKPSEVAST